MSESETTQSQNNTTKVNNSGNVELKEIIDKKDEIKKYAKYLYNKVLLKDAVQLGRRVEYFRGSKLIQALFHPTTVSDLSSDLIQNSIKLPKGLPEVRSELDATLVGVALLKHGFIQASQVKNKARRELEPLRTFSFNEEGFYTWVYEGSNFKRNFLLGLVIFGFLSAVMFPIWPQTLKVGVWYLTVTFLIFFVVLIIVRLFLYLVLWMFGLEFWLFPNLFDDDASVVESFIPIISFERGDQSSTSWMYRSVGIACAVYGVYWLYTQPTEFDEIIVIQKQFVHDLYEGKLLADEEFKSQDELNRAIPALEELKRELEGDEMFENHLGDDDEKENDEDDTHYLDKDDDETQS